jgi:hypothetical protein
MGINALLLSAKYMLIQTKEMINSLSNKITTFIKSITTSLSPKCAVSLLILADPGPTSIFAAPSR